MPLSLSPQGLARLIAEEAAVDGLYDDPVGYATFGVGHLVHPQDRWSSFLLAAARSDPGWRIAVRNHPVGARAIPYLPRVAITRSGFGALQAAAAVAGRDTVAPRRFGRPYAQCDPAQQQTVDGVLQAAVREEARLLASTVEAVLRADLVPFEQAVRTTITTALTQEEYDTLVSFVFNVGQGAFRGSTLARKINAGAHRRGTRAVREQAIRDIEAEFLRWNRSAGRVLPGLTARRRREADHFLAGARRELQAARTGMTSPGSPLRPPTGAPASHADGTLPGSRSGLPFR